MSVDFIARALAQQTGQAQSFTTLATGISGVRVPATVKVIQTSGYDADGTGGGFYVSDSLATTALATAHPRFCKTDAGGRYWRLLPDDNCLIPVVCGGVEGFSEKPRQQTTITGYSAFETDPWFINAMAVSPSGSPGPDGIGDGTVMTSTGTSTAMSYNASASGLQTISARVKAGTAARVFLVATTASFPSGALATFDLATGTVTHDDIGGAKIISLGSGWYRIEATATVVDSIGIGLSDANSFDVSLGVTATVFDFSGTLSSEATIWPDDERGAIQAAIDYCEAVEAQGTRYDAPNYALWRVARTATAENNIHTDKSGLLLQTTRSHRFISTCGGTTLWRRDTDGSAMGKAKFTTCTGSGGYYWRGGGIFVEGQTSAPADVSENSIYLYDMILDGGITDSSERNNPYGANMNSDGDGWDNSDKGIWQSNDRFCGHIVLEGRSGIRYFMGELIYSSGGGASIADREIVIGPDVDLGHTCGSCLNANGHTLKVERCRLHDAYMGIEGWTGHLGGYIRAVISDCNRNTIQGGIPNFGAGNFFQKSRPISTVVPMGHVDLVLMKAGSFEIGSWISGRIESFDCYPNIGNPAAFAGGSQEVDLHCITWADQTAPAAGVGLIGGGPGSMSTDRISVRVDCKRTDQAVADGKYVIQAALTYGSFGPDVCVWVGATPMIGRAPVHPAATVYDNAIKVLGWNSLSNIGGVSFDIEANNDTTIDVKNYGNVVNFTCTHNGSFNANLPGTGVPPGYRLFLANWTKNYVSGGAVCRIPAANLRNGFDLIIPPGFGYAELEFDGTLWSVVAQPGALTASATWNPPSVSAGASTTTTVSVIGAVVGDKVSASFSDSLQGMVLSACVSAANTVTAVLFNPTGSAIDLASGTLLITIG